MKLLKYTLLFTFLFGSAVYQESDIPKLWKEVEALENKGLTKSALEKVKQIKSLAKQNKLDAENIKALLYQSKYILVLEEDAQLSIVEEFKSEIQQHQSPAKNVLHGYLANLYWQFFQRNRYKFYNRTQTEAKVDTADFRTWDLNTLFSEIDLHFKASLKNPEALQSSQISTFDVLIDEQKNSKLYRPTLLDLLAQNALSFYRTDEGAITRPSYKFIIDDASYLAHYKDFVELTLRSKDSSSLELNALKIYQDLIRFHQRENNLKALIDVDIQRLHFVKQNSSITDKSEIFLKTLEKSKEKFGNIEDAALYDYEIAKVLTEMGQTYNPNNNPIHQFKLKEAVEICDQVISKFANSLAAEKCAVLKQQILNPHLTITTEENIPVNTVSKVLIRYKNIDRLNFNIHKVSIEQIRRLSRLYRQDQQLNFIDNLEVLNQYSADLISENDYQSHSMEQTIPALENGYYIITAQTADGKIKAFSTTQVTDFALVEKNNPASYTFQLINRLDGQPIPNVDIAFSYRTNSSENYLNKEYRTDDKGQFVVEKSAITYRDIKMLVKKDGQEAYFENFYVSRTYNERNERDKNIYNAFIFTDRSIYRPGQTVYFKGIVIRTQDNSSKVVANEKVKAELMDVNHQKISELTLATNEFGSVSGEFILPSSGLNGEYHIKLKGDKIKFESQQYFSVEEYKRPKFKVELLPITKSYKVNDSITVNGEAMAFAGSSISDANVKYRVYRKVQMPRWYYWSRPAYDSESQEIAYGNTTTDADGKFNIQFKAIPDESVDPKNWPIFHYEVSVEVTDINGETREANKTVNVGYQDVVPSIVMPDKIDKVDKELTVTLDTNNLNDGFVPASGTFKIYKLIAPDRVLRSRPWGTPDYKSLSKEEFIKLFPNESYDGEDEVSNWEKGQQVVSNTFNTKDSKVVNIHPNDFEAGTYMAIMELEGSNTNTTGNGVVKDEKIFKVFSRKDKRVADNELFEIYLDKESYQANQEVEISIGSAAKNLTVTIDIEKDQKVVNTYILELNNERKSIKIPVNKEDLGGFAILYSYAFQNFFKSASLIVPVPYPSSELSIETSTFRDKLKPGADETWEFMVKGPKGEAVSAELLASMYDKSLDQFKAHDWTFNPLQQPQYHASNLRQAYKSFSIKNYRRIQIDKEILRITPQLYDSFKWFGLNFGYGSREFRRFKVSALIVEETEMAMPSAPQAAMNDAAMDEDLEEIVVSGYSVAKEKQEAGQEAGEEIDNISIRKNLQETAFFFPQLKTDKDGNVRFSFTSPEALTSWKLQLLVHDKQLNSSIKSLETVTQKELMVLPNVPRFLRQGDRIVLSSKISNLSETALSGWAQIQLTDALTGKVITADLLTTGINDQATDKTNFSVDAKGNTQVSWTLGIPDNLQAVEYKIVAKAGDFSDGEQSALPVLTNRKLVTETLPMWVRSNESRTFVFSKLSTNTSSTLKHHKLSLEVTSNPAWLAVQSLPYLMEFPYECNEQIFSRVYANSLASYIAQSNPKLKAVFDQWATSDALISNLEKNEELKSIILTETPWLRDAKSETEQKKRIGLLFDINKMSNELKISSRKLANNQMENGAWAWFKGGLPNRYITQHIVTGFGHLSILTKGSTSHNMMNDAEIKKALYYLDAEFVKEYKNLTKYNKDVDLSKDHLSYTQLHYLYMRSFYNQVPKSKEVQNIIDYYHGQIKKYWLSRNLYSKGLMALVTHRLKDVNTANAIMESLRENSIVDEEMGMYWKENTSSWYWYQAPIETQALMIEAFSEIEKDTKTIDNLKIWLLKHKQTNSWKTTKATTDASYALLLQGSDWLSVSESVDIILGDKPIRPETMEEVIVEAGTGYFKTTWDGTEITPKMAEVTMEKKNAGIAWGALYWQYFEDLDKITSAETPLQLKKKLFKRTYSDKGEILQELSNDKGLKVGDLIRVRIELRVDRDMEFIHMKDMRAAGLEPLNVLSAYKWQDGLGYYESTKDASTDFFFDYLPKGAYVFEYDLRVNNAGEMSNGITTIQSMYAPEFSSHSEGVRIVVGSE